MNGYRSLKRTLLRRNGALFYLYYERVDRSVLIRQAVFGQHMEDALQLNCHGQKTNEKFE